MWDIFSLNMETGLYDIWWSQADQLNSRRWTLKLYWSLNLFTICLFQNVKVMEQLYKVWESHSCWTGVWSSGGAGVGACNAGEPSIPQVQKTCFWFRQEAQEVTLPVRLCVRMWYCWILHSVEAEKILYFVLLKTISNHILGLIKSFPWKWQKNTNKELTFGKISHKLLSCN